jgi:hypothetical protein
MEYYQHDLALVHARGFGEYANRCVPGILDLLAPVRGGLVLKLGCGAGALTRHEYVLVDTSLIPARLASCGVTATVASAFGAAELPPGLRAVTGVRS